MHPDLIRLVEIAGAALKEEDRLLLKAFRKNKIAYPGESGGILRLNNERYYQFIVARSLARTFPYPAAVEIDTHDLVLRYPGDKSRWFAVCEMKRWMSSPGGQEIPSIARDFTKLRKCKSDHSIMMIFSANPLSKHSPESGTKEQLKFLSDSLGTSLVKDCAEWKTYVFPTRNPKGEKVEFWIGAYEVDRTAPGEKKPATAEGTIQSNCLRN